MTVTGWPDFTVIVAGVKAYSVPVTVIAFAADAVGDNEPVAEAVGVVTIEVGCATSCVVAGTCV